MIAISIRRYRYREAAALYIRHTGARPPRRVLRAIWTLSAER
jgi:hypothetical protein